jgi:tetratricopeptide (TPR) repeat protein
LIRSERLERLEAASAARALEDDLGAVRFRLSARPSDPQEVEASLETCAAALARYGLPGDAAWDRRRTFRALEPEDQARVRAELTEACVFLARGYALLARPTNGAEDLVRAGQWNALAEQVAGADVPRVVWEQRVQLSQRLGRAEEAERAAARARETPLRSARDYFLSGMEALAARRLQEARALLARAVELNPADYWAHTGLGAAHYALNQFAAAAACYDTAIALQPDVSWGYFNRSLVASRMGNLEKAIAGLTRAAEKNPDHAETYLLRADAYQYRKEYALALQDLDRAGAAGASRTRVAFLKARVLADAGDKTAAKRTLDEALKDEPTDEPTWLERGYARMLTDPAAALRDFDSALALNPHSLAVLQNKAAVLGALGRHEDALKVLDREVELYPDFVAARADRGVMNARLGHWAEAKEDAKEALRRDSDPRNLFQVAAIHALLSAHEPAQTTEAIRLLTAALKAGFGFDYIETDNDLDPIRKTPEFQRLLAGVRALGGR